MIGVISEWARRVFRPRPAGERTDEEVMAVWITPSRPRWDYVPMDGPYRLIRLDQHDPHVYWLETYTYIYDAVIDFDRFNQPRPGQHCMVIDGRDQGILWWADQDDHPADQRYAWGGCEFMFHQLAVINPIDAAVWETIALNEERTYD